MQGKTALKGLMNVIHKMVAIQYITL